MDTAMRANEQESPGVVPFTTAAKKAVGWGPSAAYMARREGRFPIPVIEIGSRLYCRQADIDAFVSGQPHASTMQAAETA